MRFTIAAAAALSVAPLAFGQAVTTTSAPVAVPSLASIASAASTAVAPGSSSARASSSASSASASASSTAAGAAGNVSSPSTPVNGSVLAALMNSTVTAPFGRALMAASPMLNLSAALNDVTRALTILAPPAASLQALNSSTALKSIMLSGNISFVDALLALHVVDGYYNASILYTALSTQTSGGQPGVSNGSLTLPTLFTGLPIDFYGIIAPGGNASAPANGTAFFAQNAAIVRPNFVNLRAGAPGAPANRSAAGQTVHLISNVLDPFINLVGITTPNVSAVQAAPGFASSGFAVLPTWAVATAPALATPTASRASSAASSGASSSRSSSASAVGPLPIGPTAAPSIASGILPSVPAPAAPSVSGPAAARRRRILNLA